MVKAIVSIILIIGVLKSAFSSYWARNYGTEDIYGVTSASLTSDGGVIITGYTSPPLIPIKKKPFLLRLNSNGDVQWLRFYYGGDIWFNSVIQTKDGGFIVVGYSDINGSKDMFVMKLDSNGSIKWQRTYGDNRHEVANSVVETEDGGFIISGTSSSFSGSKDIWILKIDAYGNILWQRVYETDKTEEAVKILKLNDGFVIVGNTEDSNGSSILVIRINNNGDIVFGKMYRKYRVSSATLLSDGSVLLTGHFYRESNSDIFIIKLDNNGNVIWSKIYKSQSQDFSSYITGLSDGGSAVIGYKNDDLLVFKIDSMGNVVWQRTYGGDRGDFGIFGEEVNSGDILIVGKTNSFGIVTTDIWVLKTDKNGYIQDCVYYSDADLTFENLSVTQQDLTLTPVNTSVTGIISGISVTDFSDIRGSNQCIYPIENEQPPSTESSGGGGCSFENGSNTGVTIILTLLFYFLIRKLKNHTRTIDSPNSTI